MAKSWHDDSSFPQSALSRLSRAPRAITVGITNVMTNLRTCSMWTGDWRFLSMPLGTWPSTHVCSRSGSALVHEENPEPASTVF